MKQYKNNVDRPVGAILSLNTIAHTIGSAGVGAESIKLFGEEYFGIISAILTLLILVLSEIIPKTIGASYWRSLAMSSTKIIRVLIFITYPLVLLSELITKIFTSKNHQTTMSREEVSAMVDVGTTEGIFRESESKIIKSCIRLAGVKAKEVMTPSIVVESANVNQTIKEFYEQKEWKFSRIPVYDHNKDYIVGYILKDMVLKGFQTTSSRPDYQSWCARFFLSMKMNLYIRYGKRCWKSTNTSLLLWMNTVVSVA